MTHAAESMHWYGQDGSPQYQIKGANGKERPPTLRDARKIGLVPSVTSIIRAAAAPGLERWKQEQVLLAALTLPKKPDEPEPDYIARIIRDSQEQGRKAAERGTGIHAAIQGHYEGVPPEPEMWPYVSAAKEAITEHFGPGIRWVPERSFANALGYGGKVDLYSVDPPIVCDFKTKEFKEDAEMKTWDEHHMQLAAYREGLLVPSARCAIVYVSSSVPGLARVMEIDAEALDKGWSMFRGLLTYWQAKSGYRSEFEEAIAA
jgi:hypothetical protein